MGRLIMKTKDDILVMDREFDESYWYDDKFVVYVIERDAREKGVKAISHDIDMIANVINVLVDWQA